MITKVKLIVIVLFCILTANCLAVSVAGEGEKPEWVVGDTWDYSMSSPYMSVNITQVVDEITTISVNGTDYEVFSVSSDMTMSMYGIEITQPTTNYYQKSDMGIVKTESSSTFMGITSENIATFNPPKKDCSFPLEVGKTWSETCTSISYTVMDGEMSFYNEYEETYEYNVPEMDTITVPAGTFECYKIACVDEFGDFTYAWYCPEVKNIVKQSDGDTSDPTEVELTSYDVAKPKGEGVEESDGFGLSSLFEMPYLLFLIIIPIIVVVLAVALVARGRKKKRTQAQVQSRETVDFVIQSTPATLPAAAPQRTAAARPPPPRRQGATQTISAPPRPPQRTSPPRPPVKAQPRPVQQAPPPPKQQAPPIATQPPPPPPPPPPAVVKNPCPTCKSELSLIEKYNRWYCYTCKKYW